MEELFYVDFSVFEGEEVNDPRNTRSSLSLKKLIDSSKNGDINYIELCLDSGRFTVDSSTGKGVTPLHAACRAVRLDCVEYFMKRNVDFFRKANDSEESCIEHSITSLNYKLYTLLTSQPQQTKILEEDSEENNEVVTVSSSSEEVEGECSVCFEINKLFRLDCCGNTRVCSDCLVSLISTAVSQGQEPKCPNNRFCKRKLTFANVQQLLQSNPTVFETYDTLITSRLLNKMEDFVWCSKCSSGAIISRNSMCMDTQCPDCDYSYCSACKRPIHPGKTCEQKWVESIGANEEWLQTQFSKWLRQTSSKTCPQCSTAIEKNGGCSHMTCKTCNYQFCWICSGVYKGRHTYGTKCPCPKN